MEKTITEMTTEIVVAMITHQKVEKDDLPKMIAEIHNELRIRDQFALDRDTITLGRSSEGEEQSTPDSKLPPPAVTREEVEAALEKDPEHILSMVDGKRYKTLGRHLTSQGVTKEEYRKAYGLPHDFPMIAPAYAEKRSQIAKDAGLGKKGGRKKK